MEGDMLEESREGTPQPRWARNMESRLKQHMDEKFGEVCNQYDALTLILMAGLENAVNAILQAIQANQPTPDNPGPATGIRLSVGGKSMADVSLSVDVANEVVHIDWTDDKGDITTDVPAGATVNVTSSDSTVASTGSASPGTGGGVDVPLTFSKAGTAVLTAQAVDGSGANMGSAQTVNLTLTPGGATGIMVKVENQAPVPAPNPAPAPAPGPTPDPSPTPGPGPVTPPTPGPAPAPAPGPTNISPPGQ